MTKTRFVSFSRDGAHGFGAISGDGIVDLSARYGNRWPSMREVIADGALTQLADEAGSLSTDFAIRDIRFEIPVPQPEKIICVGVNFPDRNEEYKDGQAPQSRPSLFIRFPRSFTGHEQPLIRPQASEQLDYEGEVALVIGKGGRHIPRSDALDHIAAVTLCNEGSIRDWIRHAKFNVTQGKNFDSTGSMGPWLIPFAGEDQIADIRLTTRVNGETRQDDRTSRMIFDFRYQINYISTFTTLVPGDIIVTGTPTGAGARLDPPVWLKPGDIVEVEAEDLGILRNGITDEVAA